MKNKNILWAALFGMAMLVIGSNFDILSSFAMSLVAGGTNENVYLNPTGTGSVVIGGDSLVVASKSVDLTSPHIGQIYFNTTLGKFRGYNGASWVNFGTSSLLSGLVSFWKFDVDSGSVADAHGSNKLANNNGAPFVAGKINNGTDLDSGSDQYFSLSNGLGLTNNFSVSMWVKLESEPTTNGVYGLASEYDANTGDEGVGWYIRYEDVGGTKRLKVFYSNDGGATRTQGFFNTTLGTSSYKHIVVTVNVGQQSGGITVYIDGSPISLSSSNNGATTLQDADTSYLVGAFRIGDLKPFNGIIDEVGVWSRILTSNEAAELYNGGDGASHPF